MNKKEPLNKNTFIILGIVIVIVIIILVSIGKLKKSNINEKTYINNNVIALRDDNRFLTLTSIIDTYFTLVKYENVENLMIILDKKYVKENEIDSSNVLDKIDVYNTNYNVLIRRVYQVKSYNNIYIYYIKAKLIEESFNSVIHRYIRDVYYKVTINENDLTFAIALLEEKEYLNKVGDLDERH